MPEMTDFERRIVSRPGEVTVIPLAQQPGPVPRRAGSLIIIPKRAEGAGYVGDGSEAINSADPDYVTWDTWLTKHEGDTPEQRAAAERRILAKVPRRVTAPPKGQHDTVLKKRRAARIEERGL
jgi:hypothetical protein